MGYLESIACQTRSFSSIYCNLHLYYLDWNDHTTVTARVACIMRWSVSAMHIDWRLRECSSERSCLQPMLQQVVLNYNANVKFIAPPTHGPSGTLPFPGSFFFFFARAKKKYSEHVPWPVKGASLPHLQKYTSRNTHCTLQYPWNLVNAEILNSLLVFILWAQTQMSSIHSKNKWIGLALPVGLEGTV